MKQAETEKCSHGTSCNCLVALVLYKPGGITTPKCDVWRIWSQKKGNAAFHQMAMRDIGPYYKVVGKVQVICAWCDGTLWRYTKKDTSPDLHFCNEGCKQQK